jgi:hypothetical protein
MVLGFLLVGLVSYFHAGFSCWMAEEIKVAAATKSTNVSVRAGKFPASNGAGR